MINALIGGVLIGFSGLLLMLFVGRIAGISGIFWRLLTLGSAPSEQRLWVVIFILGLPAGAWVANQFLLPRPELPVVVDDYLLLAVAGFLVGFGAKLGSGCTSGHGVCGIARLSPRSLVATIVFISVGVLTVLLTNLIRGL